MALSELLEKIVANYQPDRWREKPRFYNKGVTGRFQQVLSKDEQALCRKRLGPYLQRMGYDD